MAENKKKSMAVKEANPVYNEGMRHLHDAVTILNTKGNPEGNYYRNKIQVKKAGCMAFNGVLCSLDQINLVAGKKRKQVNVKDYIIALEKLNIKTLYRFHNCYQVLHLMAGTNGHGNKLYLKTALRDAEKIIKWASKKSQCGG